VDPGDFVPTILRLIEKVPWYRHEYNC